MIPRVWEGQNLTQQEIKTANNFRQGDILWTEEKELHSLSQGTSGHFKVIHHINQTETMCVCVCVCVHLSFLPYSTTLTVFSMKTESDKRLFIYQ